MYDEEFISSVLVTSPVSLPKPDEELGKLADKLCRRVIVDNITGKPIADEAVHSRSGVKYLRTDLPPEVTNARLDYYRRPEGHHRSESSGSESGDCDPLQEDAK